MEIQSEAQARALEPTLGSATSPASRRAVRSLAALPPAHLVNRLLNFTALDLGNLVRCAIAAGASANTSFGENKATVLCLAAQNGLNGSLKALLAGGADATLAAANGCGPLHWAAIKGHTHCITTLLEAGALLEAKNKSGRTPLALAAEEGHADCIAVLLDRGAEPNTTDAALNSPLIAAVVFHHARCVELLLPRSDASVMCLGGMNAFHMSVQTASYDCFKLLLPHVADIDVRTVAGVDSGGNARVPNRTAAHIACAKGQHKMLEKLLRRGASRTARDSEQHTPLHCAAMAGQLSCIVQLIGHPEAYRLAPADINAAAEDGMTPLHCAALYGRVECCGLLKAAGARLDAFVHGVTPLMIAQQLHPSNTVLLDMLAGRGPEHPPGTTCDRCGQPEDPASHLMPCSGCQVARYCSIACQHAAWDAHEAECGRLKAERERSTRVNIFLA